MTSHETDRPIIQVEKLTRIFKKKITALREIDLSIAHGEIFGLVGPDGAGKTTALRIMAAVMTPTSGRVTIAGQDSVKDAEEIRVHVGYMPQKFSLYGDLSVRENLEFYADIFGVHGAERQRRFEQVLSFAHMTHITDRRAGKLSGGMQKKLRPGLHVDPSSRRVTARRADDGRRSGESPRILGFVDRAAYSGHDHRRQHAVHG